MKFLKNYTSNVPVSQTIYRIEQVLIRCGVSGITKEYAANGSGDILAITFQIKESDDKPVYTVRLPADKEAALNALWLNYVNGDKLVGDGSRLAWNSYKKKTKRDFADQAARTAWKIVQDWVEVQMSMIQMQQADTLQVFMPYLWNGRETLYQIAKTSGVRALLGEGKE